MSTLKITFKSGKTVKIRGVKDWTFSSSQGDGISSFKLTYSRFGVLLQKLTLDNPVGVSIKVSEIVFVREVWF
jgi:hypothetical protein